MKASEFSDAQKAFILKQGADGVATLEKVCAKVGYPRTIRVDQGSEFISRDLDLWAYAKGGTLDFPRPGKPTDKAFIEAFNGRFRSECLNTHSFLTLADAAEKMEAWVRCYTEDRPRGHRPQAPDLTAEPRRRTQPSAVTKAGNSSFRRSRKWSWINTPSDSFLSRRRKGSQVTVLDPMPPGERAAFLVHAEADPRRRGIFRYCAQSRSIGS